MAEGTLRFRILVLTFFACLLLTGLVGQSEASTASTSTSQAPHGIPDIDYQPNTVYIGMWVIDIYTFEYRGGDFSVDFWVYYFWTDANISSIDWYLRNGFPLMPTLKQMVDHNYTSPVRFEVWRVRAQLDAGLTGQSYPLDKIRLPIAQELIPHGYNVTLEWLPDISGTDPGLFNPGWKTVGYELSTEVNTYPIGLPITEADFVIIQERSLLAGAIKTILPPLMFCAISGLSFLVGAHEDSGFGLRIGLNTSMLITAILFNIAEVSDIPPVSGFTYFMVFMVAVFVFLSLNMMVTILGNIDYRRHQDIVRAKKINFWGFVVCMLVPTLIFAFSGLFAM